jgi:hypothetical protein
LKILIPGLAEYEAVNTNLLGSVYFHVSTCIFKLNLQSHIEISRPFQLSSNEVAGHIYICSHNKVQNKSTYSRHDIHVSAKSLRAFSYARVLKAVKKIFNLKASFEILTLNECRSGWRSV